MKTLYFRTNIKDETDKLAVAQVLDKQDKVLRWDIDLNMPQRLLRVYTDQLSASEVELLIQQLGYTAENTASPDKL